MTEDAELYYSNIARKSAALSDTRYCKLNTMFS